MKSKIRTYNQGDLSHLTQFLNANLDHDSLTKDLLQEKLVGDPNWDQNKALICYNDDRILGFMQGVVRDIRGFRYGYIKLMAIDEAFRRLGIARLMYEQLEAQFRDDMADVVRIYDVPMNYLMPGIDPRYTPAICFAIRMGFKRFGETCNLTVALDNADWNTEEEEKALKIHGIEIKRSVHQEQKDVIKFVEQDWALWKNEVEMAFKDNPPSIHIARFNGNIKAFSAHNGNNKGTGWFGPMGTHPDLRGKGVGGILLKRCLLDIKEMGLKTAIIPWVGPIDFYAHHVGAIIDRVFWRYEKQLKS